MKGIAARIAVPSPVNEPVRSHAPGDPQRSSLKARMEAMAGERLDIPCVIGGREVRTGNTSEAVVPHRYAHVLATWHRAGPEQAREAIRAAMDAKREWASWPFEERAAVFLRAADLLTGPWRDTLNAATMLGQGKSVYQAEIDAVCEMADFFRFNVNFARSILEEQPISSPGVWNWTDYRPLDGFIYAVTPFNFTAIAGNLCGAPALMGNTVVWKPSESAVYSGWFVLKLLEAAGLPPGVVNFIPGDPQAITDVVLDSPDFAGLHFTGSTGVFRSLWRGVGERIDRYRSYPRLVGETGGKDFILAHPTADAEAVTTAIIRGGFEYQGQKCSAASRIYLPESLWETMGDRLREETEAIRMGDPADFRNFMGAVIHQQAFDKIGRYIEGARDSADAVILAGGRTDGSEGWFVRPTLIHARTPDYVTMREEIFGPVVTLYIYRDAEWAETLELVDRTSPYGLTGAVLAEDRRAVQEAHEKLRFAAGNFYVNDKCTGAVVGQQPFGGSRASGTNDKAGSVLNLYRWVSARSVKETFDPARDYRYPFMGAE